MKKHIESSICADTPLNQQRKPENAPVPPNTILLPWRDGKPPGGAHVKILTGMIALFLGLKFGQILFFWVGKFFSYFSEFRKISAIFWGLTNFQLFFRSSNFCITHMNPLNEEHTVQKNKIKVAFDIYSNFDNHCILSHSIFWV